MYQEMNANAPFLPHQTPVTGKNRLLSELLSLGTTEPVRQSLARGIFAS